MQVLFDTISTTSAETPTDDSAVEPFLLSSPPLSSPFHLDLQPPLCGKGENYKRQDVNDVCCKTPLQLFGWKSSIFILASFELRSVQWMGFTAHRKTV